MRRFPRFPTKQTKRGRMAFNQWLGVNTTDANHALQPGYVPYGKNVDFSREPGAAAKRLGTEALFASLGAGASLGAHTYKHSSGDRVLLAWDDDVYKLAGETSTLTKTSQADFDAGALTDVVSLASGGIRLAVDEAAAESNDQDATNASVNVSIAGHTHAQTFTTGSNVYNLSSIIIYEDTGWIAGDVITMDVYLWDTDYATTIAGASLGQVLVDGPQIGGTVQFEFSTPIAVNPSTVYLFKMVLTSGATVTLRKATASSYAGGTRWYDGVDQSDDFYFVTRYRGYESSGTWLSPVYDLTNTPVNATLSWTATTPANTSITVYASGSQDNVNFGGWQVVSVSGDGIPLARYIKVRAVFATTDTTVTPVLSDFTITTETAFTTTESIKSGVSNNKVRFVDWNGECYFAYGAKLQKYDNTSVTEITTSAVSLEAITVVYSWKNYMFYVDNSDPTKLYFSDVNAPDTVGADNYKQMPNTILGMRGYNNALIVTGVDFTKAIYGKIFGTADDNTDIIDLGSEYAVSHEAMVECVDYTNRNILVFGTKAGPKYLVPGQQEQSLQTLPLARNVQKYFQNSIERQNQAMAFNKQKLYVAITYNEPGEAAVYTNNAVMCYDFQAGQWSGPWTLNVAGFTVAQGTDANSFTQSDELFIVDSTIGRLYQMDKGTSDAGSNIVYTLDTPYLGEAWNKREYQRLRLTVSDASVTTTLALTVKIDNNSDSIAPGATSTWNVGSWGGDDQGKQDAIVSPNQNINAPAGRYFGIRIVDDSTNDFIIYGLEAEYIEYVGVV